MISLKTDDLMKKEKGRPIERLNSVMLISFPSLILTIISNVLIKEMELKNNCFFFSLLTHKLTDSWINGLIDGLTDCLID